MEAAGLKANFLKEKNIDEVSNTYYKCSAPQLCGNINRSKFQDSDFKELESKLITTEYSAWGAFMNWLY